MITKIKMKINRKKIDNHLKKWWHLYVLALIVLVAFFIRTYNFADWIYLKSDQVRDIKKVQSIYEGGLAELPLLGPKASGSNLFLGPIFYYFQYASAVLFQSVEPHVLVFPDLIASLLTIPLLFYFLRQFFSKKISLLTVAVFASSYMFTQYARFGWNPNSLPFWGLLAMLGVFKVGTEKDRNKAGKWLIMSAFAFGVVSQLHFIAFLGYPIVTFLFWIFYPPKKIHPKFWLAAICVFLFLNLPMIANDTIGGGNNWKHFVYTLTHKAEPRGALESALRAATYEGRFFMAFVTSINNNEVSKIDFIGILYVTTSIFLGVFLWKKKATALFRELSSKQRAFLVFIFVWLAGFTPLYWKLAYDINNSRFWAVVFVIPFVSLALYFQIIFQIGKNKNWQRAFQVTPYLIATILIILNFTAIGKWYGSLAAQEEIDLFGRKWSSKTFQQQKLETVWVQKETSKYMIEESSKKNKKVCFKSPNVYSAVYRYFINQNLNGEVVDSGDIERETIVALGKECEFFLIDKAEKSSNQALAKVGKGLKLNDKKAIGSVAIWIVELDGDFNVKKEKKQSVFEIIQQDIVTEIKIEENKEIKEREEKEDKKPERKEDKDWGDLWY
jgi:hypothetical protein